MFIFDSAALVAGLLSITISTGCAAGEMRVEGAFESFGIPVKSQQHGTFTVMHDIEELFFFRAVTLEAFQCVEIH